MAMRRQRPTETITTSSVRQKCNTLVLKLVDRDTAARRLVENTRALVLARFEQLLNEYVSRDRQQLRSDLVQGLEEAENREKFLEAFVLRLYHQANKIEEEIAVKHLTDNERGRLDEKTGYEKNSDGRQIGNHHSDNRHPYDRYSGNHHPANHYSGSHNPADRFSGSHRPADQYSGGHCTNDHYPGSHRPTNEYSGDYFTDDHNSGSHHPAYHQSGSHYRDRRDPNVQ